MGANDIFLWGAAAHVTMHAVKMIAVKILFVRFVLGQGTNLGPAAPRPPNDYVRSLWTKVRRR